MLRAFLTAAYFITIALMVSSAEAKHHKLPYKAFKCDHEARHFNCVYYVDNYDGDTITVDIPKVHPLIGKNAKVRIRNIDTPEIRSRDFCEKELAVKARDFVTKTLVNSERIDLRYVSRGKYFRIVAMVLADGQSLGPLLVRKHYAYPYTGGTKPAYNWCELLQKNLQSGS